MGANYVLLETITVGEAGASSVTFNNIPQSGYTDLKVVYSARGLAAATDRGMFVQFNGDTTSSYTYKFLRGDGSSAGSGGSTTTFLYWGNFPAASATANTFGNGEFYIPNYTSSNYKSVSSDSVSENNATAGWDTFVAGLWSKTNAITSMLLYPESGNFAQYSTFSLYGLAAVGTTPVIAPYASGGDIIQTDGTYWYHAFLNSGYFTPAKGLSCDYLVVAGGGAGGFGGGGAGGLRSTVTATGGGGSLESALAVTANTSYSVIVGAGGAAPSSTTSQASNGNNSVFASITSIGGGAGANYNGSGTNSGNGNTGGSGGGGGLNNSLNVNTTGGTGTSGQGYAGGYGGASTSYTNVHGGGGGGAGGIGQSLGYADSGSTGGTGGVGIYTAISDAFGALSGLGQSSGGHYYFAGGGGGSYSASGGLGGGGASGTSIAVATSGTPNTGGGGGGSNDNNTVLSAKGGSGIIIVRYAI